MHKIQEKSLYKTCIGLATYIIIENSERSIVFGHNQDEEEDEE